MHDGLIPAESAFRGEVRGWLTGVLTPELRAEAAASRNGYVSRAAMLQWQRALAARGWGAPDWPSAWGGAGFTAAQRYVFQMELAAAGAPQISPMGVDMVAHVILAFGTEDQKRRHLPPILKGETLWCQGYSEAGAGSDLTALATAAVRDGDHYIVRGAKLWTTHAQYADWMFCLARTSREDRPQRGLSFLLFPMDSPGVSVRPIATLDLPGDGAQEVNEVRLDGVRTAVRDRVGEEGRGWTYAKHLLEFERGELVGPRLLAKVATLTEAARVEPSGTGSLIFDPAVRGRLAGVWAQVEALCATELRAIAPLAPGAAPGLTASTVKLLGAEVEQAVAELRLELAGPAARACAPPGAPRSNSAGPDMGPSHAALAAPSYFNARKLSIYGGTSEVQRNILAKQGLGL